MRACRLSETSSLVGKGSSRDQVVCDGSGRAMSGVLAVILVADAENFIALSLCSVRGTSFAFGHQSLSRRHRDGAAAQARG